MVRLFWWPKEGKTDVVRMPFAGGRTRDLGKELFLSDAPRGRLYCREESRSQMPCTHHAPGIEKLEEQLLEHHELIMVAFAQRSHTAASCPQSKSVKSVCILQSQNHGVNGVRRVWAWHGHTTTFLSSTAVAIHKAMALYQQIQECLRAKHKAET